MILQSSGSAVAESPVFQSGALETIGLGTESDRRAHRRLSASDLRWLRTVRLKSGSRVTLIDLSLGGVLLESDNRLCPGTTLALELIGSRQISVPLRVVRSQVASIREGALYRGACAFRRPRELPELLLPSSPSTTLPACESDPAEASTSIAGQLTVGWSMVVLRYLDGKPVKGFSNDFSASRTDIHLWTSTGAVSSQPTIVPLSRLKAVFFVHDFDGDPAYVERHAFETVPYGRQMEVTFLDGEVLVGSTLNYSPSGSGFFLCPADRRSNNIRIFVVCSSVRHARFI